MAINPKFGKQEPMKIETIKLDPERLEVVKEILAQNRMILEMILEPLPKLNLFNGVKLEDVRNEINRQMAQYG